MKFIVKQQAGALALAGASLLASGTATAAVTVSYTDPENYADLANNDYDRAHLLKEFDGYFASLGSRLPAGQNLQIEVLDVDLAGRVEPNMRGADLRILRGGADWPRMRLRYRLESNGQVLSSGEDDLSNMMYLDRMNHYNRGDTLRYEKQMLDDWFSKKFAPAK